MQMLSRVEVMERMTAADFFRDAPEDRKAELIDGVMIMPSPPLVIHERLQGFLFRLLADFVEERELGEVFGSRTAVELELFYAPEPDIFFIQEERLHIVGEKGVLGAPDFIIEILSASTAQNDRGGKLRAYERTGVDEYWLIDPYGPAGSEFYHLHNGRFRPSPPGDAGILRSVAVPGFWIDLAWLWPSGEYPPVRRALNAILDTQF
ncbi:MAG: Uma2 family endonuclease [Chloroflexi bacterium]|nr:Uma2 family endonuclease [Chloroflexota bacterium]